MELSPDFPAFPSVKFATDDIPPDHHWYPANKASGSKAGFNLGSLYAEFVRQIGTFGGVRRALRDLDCHTWVIDPPPPVQVSLCYLLHLG